MNGYYAIPVSAPARSTCDVCGAPAQLARVHEGTTLGAWCGQECAMGRRARELPLGAEVLIWTAKFVEVGTWPVRRGAEPGRLLHLSPGFARCAVVKSISETEVVLGNPGGKRYGTADTNTFAPDSSEPPRDDDPPEELRVPADFPCTRYTGITTRPRRSPRAGRLLRRWPVDGPWTRDVTFGHWVSHQPQGICEDSADCEAPATLWVSYDPGEPRAADGPTCERCLSRRLRRRESMRGTRPNRAADPAPVAVWDTTLDAWDIRPHDGSATRLA